MSEAPGVEGHQRLRLVRILARAVSINGMIGGQEQDLAALQAPGDLDKETDEVTRIHELKTSSLFVAAAESGATVAGLDGDQLLPIRQFAGRLGLAYQTLDDLLDVQGSTLSTGKDVGKDVDKPTLVGVMGADNAADYARDMIAGAMAALQPLGPDMRPMEHFVHSLIGTPGPAGKTLN